EGLNRVITKSLAFDPPPGFWDAASSAQALSEAVPTPPIDPKVPEASALKGPAPEAARGIADTKPGAPDRASMPPELLRDIERDLAAFIGPMASIAVRRALRETNDLLS